MYSSLSGRFVPNKGGVAGYVDRMRRKYRAKWGMQMAGMNFKTLSRTVIFLSLDIYPAGKALLLCLQRMPVWNIVPDSLGYIWVLAE